MEVEMMIALDFDFNCTLPQTLLESYNLAIGLCHDTQVIYSACYYIDLSLLSAEFLKFPVQLTVICALTIAL